MRSLLCIHSSDSAFTVQHCITKFHAWSTNKINQKVYWPILGFESPLAAMWPAINWRKKAFPIRATQHRPARTAMPRTQKLVSVTPANTATICTRITSCTSFSLLLVLTKSRSDDGGSVNSGVVSQLKVEHQVGIWSFGTAVWRVLFRNLDTNYFILVVLLKYAIE